MIVNIVTGKKLAGRFVIANHFWPRFWGLMTRKEPFTDEGLLLTPCNGVHTFFMSFPIDVVYLDREFNVVDLFENVKVWRVLPLNKNTKQVLELPAGTIKGTGTCKGHHLRLWGSH